MPIIKIQIDKELFQFVRCDYIYRDDYWGEMTESLVRSFELQNKDINQNLEDVLKQNYDFLCNKFDLLIQKNATIGFLIFVYTNHDVLCNLFGAQLDGLEIELEDFDSNHLAVERRVYKVILEQFTRYNLKNTSDTLIEIRDNNTHFIETLERLLYIGVQIFLHVEYISQNRLIKGALSAEIVDGFLTIQFNKLYADIFNSIKYDILKHGATIKIPEYFEGLIDNINDSFGINYGGALGYISGDESFKSTFGYFKLGHSIKHLSSNHGMNEEELKRFYAGLTLGSHNSMSTKESFFRSQYSERFLFRPILEFSIEGCTYNKTSQLKITESIFTIMSNGIPFGEGPTEWYDNLNFKKFCLQVKFRNDKVLEDPAFLIVKKHHVFVDRSVKSLLTGKNNIKIDNQKCGEIDILYINNKSLDIVVCECKNNRQRTDTTSWIKDTYKFRNEYEGRLLRKVEWVTEHKSEIMTHLYLKNGLGVKKTFDPSKYNVTGLFIINSPTLYLYDGEFRVVTLRTLEEFVDNSFVSTVFQIEDENGIIQSIKYPYFRNLKKILN